MMTSNQARLSCGFTLLEVLIALIILSLGLTGLFRSLNSCMKMVALSKDRQDVMFVFSLGDMKYPIGLVDNIEEDGAVDKDYTLKDGYAYERLVDEKEDPEEGVEEDHLYVVRTRVTWNNGRESEEIVRYVRQAD